MSSRSKATRRSVWCWHFWAGLFVAPVMLIASITGGVLVFEDDLKHAFDSAWHGSFQTDAIPVEDIPLNRLAEAARMAKGGTKPLSDVYVFSEPGRNVIFVFRDGPFDRRTITRVAVSPTRESVVEVRRGESAVETFFRVVTTVHESMFLGTPGRIIVELVTGWGVVLLVTGIVLWWPKAWRVLGGVWTLRTSGPRYRVWRDWHTVPSAYLAIPAVLVLVSGMFLSFGTGQIWTLGTFAAGGIPEVLFSPPTIEPPQSDRLDLDAALDAAIEQRPDARIYDLGMPYSKTDSLRVVAGSVAEPIGTAYVYVHPETGDVLATTGQAELPLHGQPLALAYGIHVGGIGGLATRILAVLVCLGLIAATCTGLVMWLVRRPAGRVGAPKRVEGPLSRSYVIGAGVLGVMMPSFGVSVVAVLIIGFVTRRLTR
ncbi:MAG: PepSY domain-containing protein [Planctomycetota bacterium]